MQICSLTARVVVDYVRHACFTSGGPDQNANPNSVKVTDADENVVADPDSVTHTIYNPDAFKDPDADDHRDFDGYSIANPFSITDADLLFRVANPFVFWLYSTGRCRQYPLTRLCHPAGRLICSLEDESFRNNTFLARV